MTDSIKNPTEGISTDEARLQAGNSEGDIAISDSITLDFKDGGKVILPYRTHMFEDGTSAKSISAIVPMAGEVLIAEYGKVGLMRILNESNGITSKDPIFAGLAIVGVGFDVPSKFKMGSIIIPRSGDNMSIRDTFDPDNKLSYVALVDQAKSNKALVAASAITANKDKSRVGLRLETEFIDPNTIADVEKQLSSPTNKLLFRDDKVNFINYKITHYTNIAAIIIK
jgi:hypothetical protein